MKNKRDILREAENKTGSKPKNKKKQTRPIGPASAALLIILAFAVMGMFIAYLVLPNDISLGTAGENTSAAEQSFGGAESSEPPAEVGEVKEHMADADVGDIVTFGHYEQNGISDDGAEPIEWIVLEKQSDRLLLISRYCLDCLPYNTERGEVTWASSTLREWLCSDFVSEAFSEEESASVLPVVRSERMEISPAWEEDKVSILDTEQAEQYFEYASWRACRPTEYAVSKGARAEDGNCWWWLLGYSSDGYAPYVHFNGNVQTEFAVDFGEVAVRPVVWVSAEAETDI